MITKITALDAYKNNKYKNVLLFATINFLIGK